MNLSAKTNRREFLVHGLGAAACAALPSTALRLVTPRRRDADAILVVLQLSGGNDALSTFVPRDDDAYGRARRATRLADEDLLPLDDRVGLHPALKGLHALFHDGHFAPILGVGYQDPSFSHFTAMDVWHAADRRGRSIPHGWLGRLADACDPDAKLQEFAVAVGDGVRPRAIVGARHPGLSFARLDAFRFTGDLRDPRAEAAYRETNAQAPESTATSLDHVRKSAAIALETSERMRAAADGYAQKAEYPGTTLGSSFRTIAALIAGGVRTRVYYAFQGGYDTHAGQKARHDRLMTELDAALGAFQLDLTKQGLAERVLTMGFSEFGRRVAENGSEGTDHGAAGAMFVLGRGIAPGIHGAMPSLTTLQGGGGGSLVHGTDFRSVHAAIVEHWLGADPRLVIGEVASADCIRRDH